MSSYFLLILLFGGGYDRLGDLEKRGRRHINICFYSNCGDYKRHPFRNINAHFLVVAVAAVAAVVAAAELKQSYIQLFP